VKFRDRYEHDPRCEADTTDRWFSTVRTMRTLYNVQDEDLYNFDEYRGDVDKSGHGILLAGSSMRRRRDASQFSQRARWFTVLQALNAAGRAVPPFLVTASNLTLSYSTDDFLPRTWEFPTPRTALQQQKPQLHG
jgi:hypothetical protein